MRRTFARYTSKNKCIYDDVQNNSSDYVIIKEITNDSNRSLGSINALLNINGRKITQKLNIVTVHSGHAFKIFELEEK